MTSMILSMTTKHGKSFENNNIHSFICLYVWCYIPQNSMRFISMLMFLYLRLTPRHWRNNILWGMTTCQFCVKQTWNVETLNMKTHRINQVLACLWIIMAILFTILLRTVAPLLNFSELIIMVPFIQFNNCISDIQLPRWWHSMAILVAFNGYTGGI